MRVLVVDDEELLRELVQENIELIDEGIKVDTAEDGSIAFQLAADNKYDLIFTDIKMPVMTGIELVHELHTLEAPPPVVILSGYVEEYVYEIEYKNSLYILKKPFDIDDIELLVEKIKKEL